MDAFENRCLLRAIVFKGTSFLQFHLIISLCCRLQPFMSRQSENDSLRFTLEIRTHASSPLCYSWPPSLLSVSKNATLDFIFSVWAKRYTLEGKRITLVAAETSSAEAISVRETASALMKKSSATSLYVRFFVDVTSTYALEDVPCRCRFLRRVRFSSRYIKVDSKVLGDYVSTTRSN